MAWVSMPQFLRLRQVCLEALSCTTPSLLTSATAHFRSLLVDFEWVFVDGPSECEAAPGIAAFYPPPYRCWYTTPTTAKMDSAQQLISSIIEREGPFDAVMDFSQMMASPSTIRHRLIRYHRELL